MIKDICIPQEHLTTPTMYSKLKHPSRIIFHLPLIVLEYSISHPTILKIFKLPSTGNNKKKKM